MIKKKIYCIKCGILKKSYKLPEYEYLKLNYLCRLCKGDANKDRK